MKKVLAVMMTIVMLVSLATVVGATTPNEDLKAFVSGTFKVAGQDVKLSNSELLKVDRFLADNTLTANQVAEFKASVNDTVSYINNTGVKDLADLTTEQKQAVINKASAAADAVGVTFSIDSKNNTIEVYKDGNPIESVSFEKALAKTGGLNVVSLAVVVLAIIAVAGIVAKRVK